MFKNLVIVFMACSIFSSSVIFEGNNNEAEILQKNVLIVCSTFDNGNELRRLVSACGENAELVMATEYDEEKLTGYKYLISDSKSLDIENIPNNINLLLVGEAVELCNDIKTEKLQGTGVVVSGNGYTSASRYENEVIYAKSYSGYSTYGNIEIYGNKYPFALTNNKITCVPYVRPNDLSAILLGGVMQEFFGNEAYGQMYLLIDEVYAFTDLYELCFAADKLYENALPFIVRIMPIYDNLDYPAFLRYAQVLRYMQAKNGTIVPGQALVSEGEIEKEPLEPKMERFYAALNSESIAYIEMESTPYEISIELLNSIQSENKNFGILPIDTMVEFSINGGEESIIDEVNKINSLWLNIENYRRNFTSANYQFHEISIDEEYNYVVEEEKFLAEQFAKGNEVLIVIVAMFLLALTALILIGTRVNKRKFKKGDK